MRLIDADKLKRRVQSVATEAWKLKLEAKVETTLNQFLDYVEQSPTIDAVEVVHGKWRRKMVDSGFNIDWVCSKCGYRVMTDFVSYSYCPNCGAKMKGEDDDII